jgi:TPR repeat protein
MPCRLFALLLTLSVATAVAQTLPPRPLDLSGLKQTPNADAQNSDPLAACRVEAEKGNADASFQLGMAYLIGENAPQDAVAAEGYFKKLPLESAQMCMIAEAYMETALPGRLGAAARWVEAAHAGCADWAQAVWYGGNQRGPDTAREIEFLRRVLNAKDDDYRLLAQAQLGQLLLDGTAITATPAERTAWIGAAARMRLGMAGMLLAPRTATSEDSERAFNWIRRSARYGTPVAMAQLGQAAMARTASDLSYLEGMALYAMGMRQNLLSSAALAAQIKQLEPAQIEELHNGIAYWTRTAHETGGYYAKNDPLRLPAPVDEKALAARATDADPDAEVRLAYVFEARGDFEKAEALYRTVWRNGLGRILFAQAEEAAKAKQWTSARDFDLLAADFGSREACLALASIEAQGLVEKKNPLGEYLWLLRAGSTDTQRINAVKRRLAASEVDSARRSTAAWFVTNKAFWPEETARAQKLLDKQLSIQIPGRGLTPVPQKN